MQNSKNIHLLLIGVLLLLQRACADIYMQMPRGSNNRLDEEGRERNNANRVFDSQNNNRGGYNVGSVFYYVGSTVYFEFTAQHACGDSRNHCDIIIQYTCDDLLRDGTSTGTIPVNPKECYDDDCDGDVRFGRHESLSYYNQCRYRSRNKGLFWGSQDPQGNGAIRTRQNPAGTRRGYECPEERDYYPYWGPTPWRDVAVLTNDVTRCDAYKAKSQNVKSRYYCVPPSKWIEYQLSRGVREGFIPITQTDCEKVVWPLGAAANSTNVTQAKWTEVAAWNLPPPECRENQWSRDNHNGNSIGGYMAGYNWTISEATVPHERCALRIRYNITTYDLPGIWDSDTSAEAGTLNSTLNRLTTGPANRHPAIVDMWTKYGLTYADVADSFDKTKNDANNAASRANSREYVFKDNPNVNIFGSLLNPGIGALLKLQLALNTAQYGRTFQDRTHRTAIRARPDSVPSGSRIHNLSVRGKRGNIVQVYPAVEYDFVPGHLMAANGDFIHVQWTGSNTNPPNNAGQGKAGTDRSNIVVLKKSVYSEKGGEVPTDPITFGQFGRNFPEDTKLVTFAGFAQSDAVQLAILNTPGGQFGGSMQELNDAGTYFNFGLRQLSLNGIWHYLCTRNNNFSNRSQKGKLVVSNKVVKDNFIGTQGGSITSGGGGAPTVSIPPGSLTGLTQLQMTVIPQAAVLQQPDAKSVAVQLEPVDIYNKLAPGAQINFAIPYDNEWLSTFRVLWSPSLNAPSSAWTKLESATLDSGTAYVETRYGGVYVVSGEPNVGAIAGISVGVVLFVAMVVFGVWWFWWRRRKMFQASADRASSEMARGGHLNDNILDKA